MPLIARRARLLPVWTTIFTLPGDGDWSSTTRSFPSGPWSRRWRCPPRLQELAFDRLPSDIPAAEA